MVKGRHYRLGLAYYHQTRGPRSLIESAFSSFKQRTKVFFNKITVNSETQHTPKMEKGSGMLDLFCKTFTYYYNHLRR